MTTWTDSDCTQNPTFDYDVSAYPTDCSSPDGSVGVLSELGNAFADTGAFFNGVTAR